MEEMKFYEKETRCGYEVTEKTKRVWAVQLEMLDEVERICKKYHIRYFADSGTLIGAVRHKGYIPWDDDIDLVMMREDYNRFIGAASREVKEPLFLQTVYTEKNYLKGHIQIRNSNTTGYNAEDRKAGYHCGIFIDIFPLDGVPEAGWKQRWWRLQVRTAWKVLYTWYRFGYYSNATLFGRVLYGVGRILKIPIPKAFRWYEKLCAKYSGRKTAYVCDTVFIADWEKNLWERKWFEEAVMMPFENRTIPVPRGYDGRLRAEYGDYLKPVQAPACHGELVLDPDISYKEFIARSRVHCHPSDPKSAHWE